MQEYAGIILCALLAGCLVAGALMLLCCVCIHAFVEAPAPPNVGDEMTSLHSKSAISQSLLTSAPTNKL